MPNDAENGNHFNKEIWWRHGSQAGRGRVLLFLCLLPPPLPPPIILFDAHFTSVKLPMIERAALPGKRLGRGGPRPKTLQNGVRRRRRRRGISYHCSVHDCTAKFKQFPVPHSRFSKVTIRDVASWTRDPRNLLQRLKLSRGRGDSDPVEHDGCNLSVKQYWSISMMHVSNYSRVVK